MGNLQFLPDVSNPNLLKDQIANQSRTTVHGSATDHRVDFFSFMKREK